MVNFLKGMAEIINGFHDIWIEIMKIFGWHLTDKQLHFWIMGALGIVIFFITDFIFKKLSQWSISVISFIYTFTVLVVMVLAIEIQQKITGRGNMEFGDVVAGVWGFIWMFVAYLMVKGVFSLGKKFLKK